MAIEPVPSIRPAAEADAAQIRKMVGAEHLNPLGLDWRRFYVAEADGEIVACVQLKPHGKVRELASLVVAPSWRRRGLGRSMVAFAQARAAPPLWLTCRSTLIPFYDACGFHEVTELSKMPPYFALVRSLFDLAMVARLSRTSLAVMLWQG
ncbi:MAG: GNAT family N-acetyltransferase [Anaerolineae bacterium]|nr:GNAT family N-acetyltransferase [Anaerolineae bacterium]